MLTDVTGAKQLAWRGLAVSLVFTANVSELECVEQQDE